MTPKTNMGPMAPPQSGGKGAGVIGPGLISGAMRMMGFGKEEPTATMPRRQTMKSTIQDNNYIPQGGFGNYYGPGYVSPFQSISPLDLLASMRAITAGQGMFGGGSASFGGMGGGSGQRMFGGGSQSFGGDGGGGRSRSGGANEDSGVRAAKSGDLGAGASGAVQAAMDQLRKEGVPEANLKYAAAALVGQAMAESNLVSQYHDKGKGGTPGYVKSIYGADLSRGQAMTKWLKDNGLDDSVPNQMKWMAHEAMHRSAAERNALITANEQNINQVSDVLTQKFETPRDKSAATLSNRQRLTRQAYGAKINDTGPKEGPTQVTRTFSGIPQIPWGGFGMTADGLQAAGVNADIVARVRAGGQLTDADVATLTPEQFKKVNAGLAEYKMPPIVETTRPQSAPQGNGATQSGGQKTMLYLPGDKNVKGDHQASEDAARKMAAAKGMKFQIVDGNNTQEGKEKEAQAIIAQGNVGGVVGFSQGGYAAGRLKAINPNLDYTIVGAPGAFGDQTIKGVGHFQQLPTIAGQNGDARPASKYSSSQKERPYHMSGDLTIGGKAYRFGSGGRNRGSIPYGDFSADGPHPGGGVHGTALDINKEVIQDPKYPGHPRLGIELHYSTDPALITAGCIALSPNDFAEVRARFSNN